LFVHSDNGKEIFFTLTTGGKIRAGALTDPEKEGLAQEELLCVYQDLLAQVKLLAFNTLKSYLFSKIL
jgi:hypothetical protein